MATNGGRPPQSDPATNVDAVDPSPPDGAVHESSASGEGSGADVEGFGSGRRERPSRWFLTWVGVAVVAGAVIRLAYVWFDRRDVQYWGDSYFYHQGANLLADGEGFTNAFGWLQGRSIETADHPPLYIVYLAAWSLVGVRSTTGHMVASALLALVSIGLAALVGRRVGGEKVGVVAAVLVALYPNVWRYDGMLLSETVVIVVVLACVLLAYRAIDAPTPGRFVLLAVGVGVATLARSELLLLAPVLIVPLALLCRERSLRWRLGTIAVSAAAVLGVLAPWLGLNLARFPEPVYLSTNLGGTLAVSYCEPVFEGPLLGYWEFMCGPAALDAAGITEFADYRSDGILRDAGLRFARENWARIPVVAVARVGRILGVYQPLQQRDLDATLEGTSWWVATAGLISLPAALGAATVGGIVLVRRRQRVLPLVAPIIVTLAAAGAFYGATRLRASAEGPICVLAAVALVAGWDAWRRRMARGALPGETATVRLRRDRDRAGA